MMMNNVSNSRCLLWRCVGAASVWTMTAAGICRGDEPAKSVDAAIMRAEFIYESAPFPQCHAATLVETKAGLVAAWFGGTREGHTDVGIWFSRLAEGRWTAPVEVATGMTSSGERYPCWNPVLFQPKSGPLLLFYKVGPSPEKWWGMLITSEDAGRTWSVSQRLPEGILGPIKNKPVELADGTIICPTSSETPEKPSKWRVHFERTGDLGRSWQRTQAVNDGLIWSAIQPSILVHEGGRLQAVGRTRQGKVFQIRSEDGGLTWGAMTGTVLPNPNSGTDAVTLRDGRDLMVYNHTTRGRSPLNVAVAGGEKDWQAALVLEDQPGEYSYPAVIQTADGLVHAAYTWKRQRIKHVVIDPMKLAPRPLEDGNWPH